MRWAWGWRWIGFLLIVAGVAVLGPGWAQASVNLPLHHWSYEAIERLTALGIIDRAMVVAKPYSRKQAAKYVARDCKSRAMLFRSGTGACGSAKTAWDNSMRTVSRPNPIFVDGSTWPTY